jgi:hypothetical protein
LIKTLYEAPLADLTPLTGMSLAFVGEDLHSKLESPNDQDLHKSDVDTSLATLKITVIMVALKECVI